MAGMIYRRVFNPNVGKNGKLQDYMRKTFAGSIRYVDRAKKMLIFPRLIVFRDESI